MFYFILICVLALSVCITSFSLSVKIDNFSFISCQKNATLLAWLFLRVLSEDSFHSDSGFQSSQISWVTRVADSRAGATAFAACTSFSDFMLTITERERERERSCSCVCVYTATQKHIPYTFWWQLNQLQCCTVHSHQVNNSGCQRSRVVSLKNLFAYPLPVYVIIETVDYSTVSWDGHQVQCWLYVQLMLWIHTRIVSGIALWLE